jgi:peroxiredoxin
MIMTASHKNIQLLKFLLFIPFFIVTLFGFFQLKKYRFQSKRQAINQWVGKPFPVLPLENRDGKTVRLDLSQSAYTIVDFWFGNCPGCITEMKQFDGVLKEKEKNITIVSISIDPREAWQKTFEGNIPAFSFLTKPVINWHHLLVNFNQAEDKNNAQHLSEILNVTGFPSYFVLDKQGIIKATPASAVNYIKTAVSNENEFLVFIKSTATWKSVQTILFVILSLLLYNALFNFILSKRKAV